MSLLDSLGDRIKDYERRETDRRALKGLPVVVRCDGRSFSRFTHGMARPYDTSMADLMLETAKYLVEQVDGARVAYTQSDEISLIIDPFRQPSAAEVLRSLEERLARLEAVEDEEAPPTDRATTVKGWIEEIRSGMPVPEAAVEMMFDGRFQKLTSVIGGLATARFVSDAVRLWPERCQRRLPVFDCRVFEVPSRAEAVASLVFRELDATKNAVSMAARAYFSHRELQGKSSPEMQEMLFRAHGVNFNDYPPRFKRGVYVQRRPVETTLDAETLARIPEDRRPTGPVLRSRTLVLDLPPILKVVNRVEVLLDGAEPVTAG